MKMTEKEMQDEAEKLLTCSEEELNEIAKDNMEIIKRISKNMPSPEEMIIMANKKYGQ